MAKNDGGPAFPPHGAAFDHIGIETGMSLRDYFATGCNISVYSPANTFETNQGHRPTTEELAAWIAQVRYMEADAMLAARSEGDTGQRDGGK